MYSYNSVFMFTKKIPTSIVVGIFRSFITDRQDYFGNNLPGFCAKYLCGILHLNQSGIEMRII